MTGHSRPAEQVLRPGSGVTQRRSPGTRSGSNKVVTLEIRYDQLTTGRRYVQLSVPVGTNAVLIAALAIGGEAIHKPGDAGNLAAVAQRLVM